MKKLAGMLVASLALFLGGCSFFTTTTTSTTVTTTDNENTDPVEIWTIEDLQSITSSDDVELMADIDLQGVEWEPLCSHESPYAGTFNGNGHVISNMTITLKNTDFNGLFASITGDVSNLTIENYSISYTSTFLTFAGGLAGELSGDVTNVFVDGDITIINAMSSSYVGLLAGLIQAPVTSTMTATEFVPNTISGNQVIGSIDVQSKYFAYVGGLAGKTYNTEIIGNEVFAQIDVSCDIYRAYVGGLVGHHYGGVLIGYEDYVDTSDIMITDNTIISEITVSANGTQASIGGLIGYSQFGVMIDNFAVSTISVSGSSLNIGAFLGEGWYGRLENSVSVTDVSVTLQEDQTLFVSSLAGFMNDEFTQETNYYLISANVTIDTVLGLETSKASLSVETFYSTVLNWDETYFDFALLMENLPE
ncbi:MAG: hypothetical protein KKE16_05025 [Firmicutes bacterium]|nr:hypothetical protein [Bacillota bacterium]